MKAVVIKEYGEPKGLVVDEKPIPEINEYEVLIKVVAAGVNRPDVLQRQGKYPAPAGIDQTIPGLEVSGIIQEIGDKVEDFKIGDRVMALIPGCGYAEYVKSHYGTVTLLPTEIPFDVGATLPETLYTVWHNLFQRGKLKPGERVLIHGGAGGIGCTAIQLAKLFGAHVITTVSSDKKLQFVKKLGANEVINYKTDDFEVLLANNKVDLILDYIGGYYFDKNINVLNDDGRLIYINAMEGPKVNLNLFKLMQKRITLSGSTLRNRSTEFKTDLNRELVNNILPLIKKGLFVSPIYRRFGYEQAWEAHSLMESNDFLGKLVLIFDENYVKK